jgi:hypothetical protein
MYEAEKGLFGRFEYSKSEVIPAVCPAADGVGGLLDVTGEHMGSRRECTRILGLEGFRVETIMWDGDGPSAPVRIANRLAISHD